MKDRQEEFVLPPKSVTIDGVELVTESFPTKMYLGEQDVTVYYGAVLADKIIVRQGLWSMHISVISARKFLRAKSYKIPKEVINENSVSKS